MEDGVFGWGLRGGGGGGIREGGGVSLIGGRRNLGGLSA